VLINIKLNATEGNITIHLVPQSSQHGSRHPFRLRNLASTILSLVMFLPLILNAFHAKPPKPATRHMFWHKERVESPESTRERTQDHVAIIVAATNYHNSQILLQPGELLFTSRATAFTHSVESLEILAGREVQRIMVVVDIDGLQVEECSQRQLVEPQTNNPRFFADVENSGHNFRVVCCLETSPRTERLIMSDCDSAFGFGSVFPDDQSELWWKSPKVCEIPSGN